jgi:hypothetical protein
MLTAQREHRMIRNRRNFFALWASALIMGLSLGGAPGLTKVWAKSPPPPPEEPQLEAKPGQIKVQPAEKPKPAPLRCKATKDCQKGQVCQKAGDHKECVTPPAEPPEAPVT